MPNLNGIQDTFVMLKPETLRQQKVGTVIGYIDQAGLKIVAVGQLRPSYELARALYTEHENKPYDARLMAQIVGNEVIVFVVRGVNAVRRWRDVQGHYDERLRKPGTVRGDLMKLGDLNHVNFTHGSKLVRDAKREIRLFRSHLHF